MGQKGQEGEEEMKLPSVKAVTVGLELAVWGDLREDSEELIYAPSLSVENTSEGLPSLRVVRSWMLRLRAPSVV